MFAGYVPLPPEPELENEIPVAVGEVNVVVLPPDAKIISVSLAWQDTVTDFEVPVVE
jgi:hypothetical protein